MPSKVRRIDYSPDEWIAGTLVLTVEEEGLYSRLVARIYSRGGPLEMDGLAAYCRCDPRRFSRLLQALVKKGKVKKIGERLTIDRCEVELKSARDRVDVARKLAAERWKSNGVADAAPQSKPSTTNHQPSKKKKRSPPIKPPPKNRPAPTAPDGANLNSPRLVVENPNVRGTRLAPDWQPSAADCEFAYAHGLDPAEVADQFADYWRAEAGPRALKRDWAAAWRNWCRRQHQPRRDRSEPAGWLAALRRVRLAGDC